MKNEVLKTLNLIAVFVLVNMVVFLGLLAALASGVIIANAETSPEVLQDLRKDKDFDENNYPYVKDDYGLYVIQVAESANKELFVYAYQPCHDTYDLVGTKISISYGFSIDGSGLSPQLYNLQLISTSGTLDKYYVEDFTVPNDGDRYYNIVEIFRVVNTEIDGEQDPSFPKTDKAYSVGQQWYCYDLNKSKRYEMNTFDTLPVETVFNSFVNFPNGIQWENLFGAFDNCDCWFYCFNVDDYVVTHIFDADLNYSVRDAVHGTGLFYDETEYSNERVNQVLTLKDTDVMSYIGRGLLARSYKWNRILSSEEFIKIAEGQKVKFVESDKEKILSSQWVFTYLETEKRYQFTDRYNFTYYSDVYDVGLLRLHFQDMSGNYYDLGVVNDLTDPDDISSGSGSLKSLTEAFGEFWDMFIKVVLIIVGVILLVLLLNFVTPVMGILKFILKAIVFVVSAPFKLLKKLFKKDG